MVALRRRHRESESTNSLAPQMGQESTADSAESAAVVAQGPRTTAVAVTPANAAPPPQQPATAPNDLRARLADLQRAEQVVREYQQAERAEQIRREIASHVVQPQNGQAPAEQRVEFNDRDHEFVAARNMTLDEPRIVRAAEQAIAAGHKWPTDEFYRHMEALLPLPQQEGELRPDMVDYKERRLYREPDLVDEKPRVGVPTPAPPVRKPAAAMLASEPEPEHDEPVMTSDQQRRAAMTSAPPHRESVSVRTGRPDSASRVRLSATELEIAASSGLTPEQYAREKLRMLQMKRDDPAKFSDR